MNDLKVCPQCGTEYPPEQRFCPTDGSPLRSKGASADLVGSVVADRYLILQTLGEGGMGRVYLAEHVRMGRKCALKVMNPRMASDPDAISRFNREAANACKISHPHVAAVYDFGETSEGLIYLAMEFVDGLPLTRLVEQMGALPPHRAADIARQTADALAAAHEMGIVHRDLKPDNIMITRNRDGSDCVKVVDFGIAKAADNDAQKVTKTGLVVGTPEYMSPEQLAGDKLDGRSDIYSLALVAFNMLTGALPFPADSQQEAMIMRLTDRPKRLEEMSPAVPWSGELQAVLDKGLARDVRSRFQKASEFGRAMVQAVDGDAATTAGTEIMEPPAVVAPPPVDAGRTSAVPATVAGPPAGGSIKQVRGRRRFPMWAGAAIMVLAVGGLGAAVWMKGDGQKREAVKQVTGQSETASETTTVLNNPLSSAAPKPRSLDDRLREVETLTTPDTTLKDTPQRRRVDSLRAIRALAILDSAKGQLVTAEDSAYAQLLRGEALMGSQQLTEGCREIAGINTAALGSRRRRVQGWNTVCALAK